MIRRRNEVAADRPADALTPGTPITMTPAGASTVLCLAQVLAWSTSPSGLVVTARAATDPGSASQLDNRNVFVSGRTPDDALVVFEAVARHSMEGPGVLELISVTGLAREHRRAAVRAAIKVPVIITGPAAGMDAQAENGPDMSIPGTTIDLSGDGCRLRLDRNAPLSVGASVVTVLDLGRAQPIRVLGVVVRAAGELDEIIISFDPLSVEDAAAIDATVYAALRS